MTAAVSNLRLSTAPRSPDEPIDPVKWITAVEAAGRLGISRGNFNRRCARMLTHQGLARMGIDQGLGGSSIPQWWVCRTYDIRLAADGVGELFVEPTLEHLTEKQRQEVWDRVACVNRFREAKSLASGSIKHWLGALLIQLRASYPNLGISQRTLYRWNAAYKTPADAVRLADKRGGNTRGEADPAAWQFFLSIFLSESCPKAKECWRQTGLKAKAEEWLWLSYTQFKRQLGQKLSRQQAMAARNPQRFKRVFEPYHEQHPERFPAGYAWVSDHSQLDLWCWFGGRVIRPWVTTIQDWRTRTIVGAVMTDEPNSSSILAALHVALTNSEAVTPPAVLILDNGKDFESYFFHGRTKKERRRRIKIDADSGRFAGIFTSLGIEVSFTIPFGPNGKARMERWFGTLHDQFDRSWPTYCGHNHETRPERLAEILGRPQVIPTYAEISERFSLFVKGYNHNADHSIGDLAYGGQRLAPAQALAMWCEEKRVLADPSVLPLLLMKWLKPVKAGRNGLSLRIAGVTVKYGQHDQALAPFKAESDKNRPPLNVSYNPDDLRAVRVYDGKGRLVTVAPANEFGGRRGAIGEEQLKELFRSRRQYVKAQKVVESSNPLHRVLPANEAIALTATAGSTRASGRPDRPPAPVTPTPGPTVFKPVRTPLDGQSRAVASAELRPAVGSESTPLPDRVATLEKLRRRLPGSESRTTTLSDLGSISRRLSTPPEANTSSELAAAASSSLSIGDRLRRSIHDNP